MKRISANDAPEVIRVNALRVEQRPDVPMFVFAVNGRLISQIAAVDPVERTGEGVLTGYQRERVARHIAEIHAYLQESDALLPNAIVLAIDEQVGFTADAGAIRSEWGTPGTLTIPFPSPGGVKPASIVDGQQRVSALAELPPDRGFPVVIVAFQSPTVDLNREQFVLVNRTRSLPRDLLNELLPHIDTALPKSLHLRQQAAAVLELLRYDKESPFFERIRGVGTSAPGSNISQASILSVIESSIRRGLLAEYYSEEGREADIVQMARVVSVFYGGVEQVWPFAWSESPWTSRLVHGVGIGAMGQLMEVIMNEVDATRPRAAKSVQRRLAKIEHRCAWTEGHWPDLGDAWNELQNTSQDKRRLGHYLVSEYQRSKKKGTVETRPDRPASALPADSIASTEGGSFDEVPLALIGLQTRLSNLCEWSGAGS